MSELYEFAKNVDILFVFFIIYGMTIGTISYGVCSFACWFGKKWDAFWKKHFHTGGNSKSK